MCLLSITNRSPFFISRQHASNFFSDDDEIVFGLARESPTFILHEGTHPVIRAIEVQQYRKQLAKLSLVQKNIFVWSISRLKCIFRFLNVLFNEHSLILSFYYTTVVPPNFFLTKLPIWNQLPAVSHEIRWCPLPPQRHRSIVRCRTRNFFWGYFFHIASFSCIAAIKLSRTISLVRGGVVIVECVHWCVYKWMPWHVYLVLKEAKKMLPWGSAFQISSISSALFGGSV